MAKSRRCLWCVLSVIVSAAIAIVVVFFVKKKMDDEKSSEGSVDDKFADALEVAMQFFDVQKSGKLVDDIIPWRGDSGLKDGSEAKLDLSKGMYDAGDNLKFGFPMAFTATVLSWAILEYGHHMEHVNQLEFAKGSLRWITDFLINAHPSENVLYIQVGDPKLDHKCWEKPEKMTGKRPLKHVSTSIPGSDVAAETAAAMASASLVFRKADSAYSSTLLKHAKQLFTFANKHKGCYTESLPEIAEYYNSTGYGDELIWGASWLYHATGDKSYLEYVTGDNAETYAEVDDGPTWFSWDNKLAGAQVLLSRLSMLGDKGASGISGLQDYKKAAQDLMCALLPDSPSATSSRTKSGLIWISEWDSLQHPVGSAFLAALYSDYMRTSNSDKLSCGDESFDHSDIRDFAKSQAEYVLGDNPKEISYLVGYGDKYPKFVHHRGASIPAGAKTGCSDGFKWLASKKPNPNVAMGAMVGGPFKNESFIDSRNNSMQTEPTTYNSALLVGLLSSLVANSDTVKSLRGK
ncbi:glycosyl hydrolase 9B5 [Hibiscus trionum]|uniref:Endoglucanase n=1 Tax=Hibiscus trionum TaxID=183268 RepID=A0A9W7IIQ4_HIBTR|nr:glycosyl hydrolase 9B5 [Hibiscus trionum]